MVVCAWEALEELHIKSKKVNQKKGGRFVVMRYVLLEGDWSDRLATAA